MESPRYIETPAQFWDVIALGETTESAVLEFKQDYGERHSNEDEVKKKAQMEVCRDIAQFANTLGGCVLVGIEEGGDKKKDYRVAKAVNAVSEPDVLKDWIAQAVKNYLVPSTTTYEVTPIDLDEGVVLAVNVGPSSHLVAVYDREKGTIQYLHRTPFGKRHMNPDEAERHLMNGSRAGKLAVMEARQVILTRRHENQSKEIDVNVCGGVWSTRRDRNGFGPLRLEYPIRLGQINDRWFDIGIAMANSTHSVNIPYGVVEEAWVDASGLMSILLTVRIRFNGDLGFSLEPYGAA